MTNILKLFFGVALLATFAHDGHGQAVSLGGGVLINGSTSAGDVESVQITTTAPLTGSATCSSGPCSFTIGIPDAGAAATGAVTSGAQTFGGIKTFAADPLIPDEAYSESAWNGVLEPTTKNAVRDKLEALAPSGVVPVANVATALKTRSVTFRIGSDQGAALADTDGDELNIWANRLGQGVTITEVFCETDQGTSSINLQRDDGSPANILSSNLTCSTTGATGTIAGAEDNLATTQSIDSVMVDANASGAPERVTVTISYTLD